MSRVVSFLAAPRRLGRSLAERVCEHQRSEQTSPRGALKVRENLAVRQLAASQIKNHLRVSRGESRLFNLNGPARLLRLFLWLINSAINPRYAGTVAGGTAYTEVGSRMKGFLRLAGIASLVASMALSGCVVIESSSIGGRQATGQATTASTNGYGILRLSAPVGLTTGANSQLATGCPSGKFTNPQTELSMRDFIIVQYYTVTADAVCQ